MLAVPSLIALGSYGPTILLTQAARIPEEIWTNAFRDWDRVAGSDRDCLPRREKSKRWGRVSASHVGTAMYLR
jgi:hypothetical protein